MGKIGRLRLKEISKITHDVSGKELHYKEEMLSDVTFPGKTLKAKTFVLKSGTYLYEIACMELFNLLEL